MALVPLALLCATLFLAVGLVVADGGVFWRVLLFVPVVGSAYLLSALAWRGTKRALHAGQYSDGLFVARLTAVVCGVIGAFLLWYVLIDGNRQEPSMLVPFLAVVVVWLPVLPLQTRSARAWPERVLLRRGADVHSEKAAGLVAAARAHTCGTTPPLLRHRLVPPEAPEGIGGDWMYLAVAGAGTADRDPQATSPVELHLLHDDADVAVRAPEHLLALVPPGGDAVPARRRIGRPFPVLTPMAEWTRPTLEQRLTERRAVLARVEQEVARRGATATW
jgi:hypothetical protein